MLEVSFWVTYAWKIIDIFSKWDSEISTTIYWWILLCLSLSLSLFELDTLLKNKQKLDMYNCNNQKGEGLIDGFE